MMESITATAVMLKRVNIHYGRQCGEKWYRRAILQRLGDAIL